jgi:hypothetical protein
MGLSCARAIGAHDERFAQVQRFLKVGGRRIAHGSKLSFYGAQLRLVSDKGGPSSRRGKGDDHCRDDRYYRDNNDGAHEHPTCVH